MKKQAVVFISAIFFSVTLFSQDRPDEVKNRLRFGIKAGVAIADHQYKNTQNLTGHSSKTGGMAGVFARTPLKSQLFFQPELLMVGKGSRQENQYYDYRLDATYIELPLNLLFKSADSRRGFFIGGGPAPSILIGESIFYFGNQNTKTFDLGINLLTGFELPIGFSINLNYTHGLINVASEAEGFSKIKNKSFGLTIGYLF